ncbi:hypothetical protein [Microcystis sp. BLCC-F210]|uniref:hypothetical protein n=1 Tax=Microcystis sp. BLCC-F210 TaxID=3342751 RepID=UPI0035C90A83
MAIRIKLWADYGSYPLWGVDEIDNIAPEELPLSQATIQRLNAWQDTYDKTLNQDYPPLSDFPNQQAEMDFRLFWFLCGNEVYTDSFFDKIVLKVLPDKHFTIP